MPGVLISIAEIEPPYIAPIYNDTSILIPLMELMPYVMGNKRAMPMVEVKPGIAPTRMPISMPMQMQRRLVGDNMLSSPEIMSGDILQPP